MTKRQKQILDAFNKLYSARGISPSLEDIALELTEQGAKGGNTASALSLQMKALVDQGYLERVGSVRGWRPVERDMVRLSDVIRVVDAVIDANKEQHDHEAVRASMKAQLSGLPRQIAGNGVKT